VQDERSLLERARQYDPQALEEIYDRYFDRLYRYAYRYLGEARAAEDLAAEVFLKLLEAIKNSRAPHTHLQAWLYRVAHNLLMDQFRRQKVEPPLPLELEEERLPGLSDPSIAVEEAITRQQLWEAVTKLTEDQRQVILLKFGEGLSNAEVGRILGKPEGAVKSLQHRALRALHRLLTKATPQPRGARGKGRS